MTEQTSLDLDRAEAILASMLATITLIDADAEARAGRGGITQIMANVRQNLTYNAGEYAKSFNLPWGGPTLPVPANPTGGE